jgi:glucosylceramidase
METLKKGGMSVKKFCFKTLLVLCFIVICTGSIFSAAVKPAATWVVTTAKEPWTEGKPIVLNGAARGGYDLEIDPQKTYQEITGFGGCFNEKGWVALSLLSETDRDSLLRAFFDPKEGCRFNICRVPIGASDYAVDRYTLDETAGDYEMKQFSIERDRQRLIPYIKAAMKYRPDLKIWGSAWTPPTWMKTNGQFDGGNMKDDPKIYDAYALYLAKFLESYQAQGINAFAVCVQNEPLITTHYPSCLWTPEQFRIFVRDHLGPLFTSRGVKGEMWLGTLQDADYTKFPETVLRDPEANRYIRAVGYQWDGLRSVAQTRENFPEKQIVQTETECGNWHWKPGFDPNMPQNDWDYGVYTWDKVRSYLTSGANAYMLWNMVLDREGKSIDSERPWPQNAAVVVDTKTKSVIYTPMFYAFKHYCRFIEPGARRIRITGDFWNQSMAFKNPGGQVVLVLQNDSTRKRNLKVKVADRAFSVKLPAKSWSTIIIP